MHSEPKQLTGMKSTPLFEHLATAMMVVVVAAEDVACLAEASMVLSVFAQ